MSTQFPHALSLFECRNSAALVSGLSVFIRPPAIILGVISSRINSIKRGSFRAFAHISKKIRKLKPLWGYLNPSTSILVIGRPVRVSASLHHRAPSGICPRPEHTMLFRFVARGFSGEAPAGPSVATSQCIDGHNRLITAFTFATPERDPPSFFACWLNSSETSKRPICNVFHVHKVA